MTIPLFPGSAPERKPPNLRGYQERGIRLLRMHVVQGHKRILAAMPTGGGKMVLTAAITRTAEHPTLFVCHRLELIDQCVDQLGRFGLTNVGVIRGSDERFDPGAATQVASIQTLARRDKPKAGIIFIDEAHRAGSDSYVEHVFAAYPDAVIIGWTATPSRLDGRPLGGDLFQVLEVIATYTELLKKPEWLVAPDVYSSPPQSFDLSRVKVIAGDFDEGALGEVMRTDRLEGQIVDHWLKLAHRHPIFERGQRAPMKYFEGPRRRTLVFAVNVAHSMSLAAKFEQAGIRAAHVDGRTPENIRRAALRDLASGELEVVANCGVFLEGTDVPEVKCIVHARPTQSITLWRQSVGRCMRPALSQVPLLLDHAGNFDRLGCPFEDLQWSLSSRPSRPAGRLPMKLCKKCYAYMPPQRVTCEFCGYVFTKDDDPKLPSETAGELQLRQAEPDDMKRAFFWRQVVLSKSKGFKPGFAAAIFKDHYGTWPPREWSDAVKADYANDAAWQTALAKREDRKRERVAREKKEESELEKQMADTLDAIDCPECVLFGIACPEHAPRW
jgi:DNA repair protein RadD